MARRLNTYVHVDGVAYGPDDKVPAAVAKKILAPDVWTDDAVADTPADDASAGGSSDESA